MCNKMVPKNLTTVQKASRRDVCLDLLDRLEREPEFFNGVITGDESWILEYDPETKRQSREWHTANSPRPKKARMSKCERHFSSRLPPSGGTWKYAKAPSTIKTWRDSLPIDMLLSAVSVLVVAQSSSEIREGLMNNSVYSRSVLDLRHAVAESVEALGHKPECRGFNSQ